MEYWKDEVTRLGYCNSKVTETAAYEIWYGPILAEMIGVEVWG